jgi:hypothetical protein
MLRECYVMVTLECLSRARGNDHQHRLKVIQHGQSPPHLTSRLRVLPERHAGDKSIASLMKAVREHMHLLLYLMDYGSKKDVNIQGLINLCK